MKMPAVARLLGRENPSFRVEVPSDFCKVCRLVEQASSPHGPLIGEVDAVESELREARARFPSLHYEVNFRLKAAINRLNQLEAT